MPCLWNVSTTKIKNAITGNASKHPVSQQKRPPFYFLNNSIKN